MYDPNADDSVIAVDEDNYLSVRVYFGGNEEEHPDHWEVKGECRGDGCVHLYLAESEPDRDNEVYYHACDLPRLIHRLQAINEKHQKWMPEWEASLDERYAKKIRDEKAASD